MSPATACPRCLTTIGPGIRTCPGCGFDVSWDQQGVTTVAVPAGSIQAPPALLDQVRQATLGEYEILGELGSGGMATVFLAYDIALGRKVAIKWMSPALFHGPGLVERFKREARLAGGLSHPHIIPIYAVRDDAHALYFVMKYVAGRPLDSIIRQLGPLPLPMIRSILTEVGAALDYAHRQDIVHRDVKPGNIMVDEEGFAVVTDFGIAKHTEAEGLTQTGTTVGTPSFLSPEACSGHPVTGQSDQYSLGVVAYQMLTGHLPFTAESSMGVMYAQVNHPPPPIRELRPDCPEPVSHAVLRMLAKRPEDRWPTMKEATNTLAEALPPADDTVRLAIGALARNRSSRGVENLATPASPVPTGRRTPGGAALHVVAAPARGASGAGTLPRVRHGVSRLWIVAAGAGLAATVWLLTHQGSAPAPSTTPPADPTEDSLYVASAATATYARQRASDAGVGVRSLAEGDSLSRRADSLARVGQKAAAAVLLTRASSSWDAAEKAVAARAAAPPRPPAGAGAPPARPPAVPVGDSATIAGFYTELARAISARQLGEVKRLLSNLTQFEENNWRALFEDGEVSGIEAEFTVLKVNRQGETAYASLWYRQSVTRKGKIERKDRRQNAVLTLGPQGWRQIKSEDIR